MNKEQVYEKLEEDMLKYSDLVNVSTHECEESMQLLQPGNGLAVRPIEKKGNKEIYVRETVAKKLTKIATRLRKINKNYDLEVVYGYRSLSIQRKLFNEFKDQYSKSLSGIDLLEAIHRNIAVPEVSGHPTGGAIDVQILQNATPLDFGTKIWEFCKDSYSYSPFVCELGKGNRGLLREFMLEEEFAPFNGEWWHFSYGDREWAKYYNKSYAIYEQLNLKSNSAKKVD